MILTRMNSVVTLIVAFIFMVAARHVKLAEMKSRKSIVKKGIPLESHIHELVFHINSLNMELLEKELSVRSNPYASKYQEWLSFEQVASLTSNEQGANQIISWLESAGVTIISITIAKDYIRANAPILLWEHLLQTEFYTWHDQSTSDGTNTIIRASTVSIPEEHVPHIKAIFYSVQAPFKMSESVRTAHSASSSAMNIESTGLSSIDGLRSLYGIPANAVGSELASQTVFETGTQYFSSADLHTFQQMYNLPIQDPILLHTASVSSSACATLSCDESNLDLQYISAVAPLSKTSLWYDASPYVDSFVTFLTEMANTTQPAYVLSISYGASEQDVDDDTISAFNTLAMKLAAMGVTIVVASGDNGATKLDANTCSCSETSGSSILTWSSSTSWAGVGYFPSFPASCPYVTAVGATQGRNTNGLAATSVSNEIACSSSTGGIISSGGGFSTYFAQPIWQQSAASAYFQSISSQPSSGFNQNGRGLPDVALSGVYYPTIIAGATAYLFGTSAAAPVFAAFLSLVNAGRLAAGKSSVGFINPTLYSSQNKDRFNDITEGNNKCCSASSAATATCCAAGFAAASGWDPVTGLGSISIPNLGSMFNASLLMAAPTTKPTPSPTAVHSFCDPYTSFGSNNYFDCNFMVCSQNPVTVSLCSSDSGICSGDTYLQLLDSTGTVRLSNDDTCGRCSRIIFTQSTSQCTTYVARQFCYVNTACSGTTSIANGIVVRSPTASPTASSSGSSAAPSLSSSGYCQSVDALGQGQVSDCQFRVCNSLPVILSTCTAQGGTCSGDPFLRLLDPSGKVLLTNDDYCGRCPQISFMQSTSTCVTYTARLSCAANSTCAAMLAVTNGYVIVVPSAVPTAQPTLAQTIAHIPSASPSNSPTIPPIPDSTMVPSNSASMPPVNINAPSQMPVMLPSFAPTTPSPAPIYSSKPSAKPTPAPVKSSKPSANPSPAPARSCKPTARPTRIPTRKPISQPTTIPVAPSLSPVQPSMDPSATVTAIPSTSTNPTPLPSTEPTPIIGGLNPTPDPSFVSLPTSQPIGVIDTAGPTPLPTEMPTMCRPTIRPTKQLKPSAKPTRKPTRKH